MKQDALENLKKFSEKWGSKYRFIKSLNDRSEMIYYFTYLDFNAKIQKLIYTTNWIENLNKRFRKVLKTRNSMPSDESVLLLLSSVAIDKVDKHLNYPIYQFRFDKNLLTAFIFLSFTPWNQSTKKGQEKILPLSFIEDNYS